MTDLSYSITALQELGSELLTITDVMNGASPAVQYDADDVGHALVHEALEHFSDNWDDKREQLTGSLSAVGGMAMQSADVFAEADDELAAKARTILQGQS
jgi:hypothetical protein